jgi:hypothetical protein
MNPDEALLLLAAYRDGTISEPEARRLAEAIRRDAALAGELRREMEFSGLAAQALEGDGGESFVRSLRERAGAERQATEFIRILERRASARRAARVSAAGPLPVWVPAAASAAVFLLILGLALVFSRTEPPAGTATPPPDTASTPAPRPEPPPEIPASPEPSKGPAPLVIPPGRPLDPPPPLQERTPPPLPEAPARPSAPLPAPAPPPPPPREPTRVLEAVAELHVETGTAWVLHQGARSAETRIPDGAGVQSSGVDARAVLLFRDGTRLTLMGDTRVPQIQRGPKGTRIALDQGRLVADIGKQPADQPFVFLTPHTEVRVLGTILKLGLEDGATRLEVVQGKVRLYKEGRSLDVGAGQLAWAGAQGFIPPRPIHPDEILLLPSQGRITGAEWSLVRDLKSTTGWVFEAGNSPYKPWDHVESRLSYVTYTFQASAEREYRLWVKTSSVEKRDWWLRDQVVVEPVNAVLSRKCDKFGNHPTSAYVFTGVAATTGYSWLSGHGESWLVENPPLTVRFKETGPQALRIFVGHPSVRIDAVWLSASQKSRPPAKYLPPIDR